jgi:hypothetical protein
LHAQQHPAYRQSQRCAPAEVAAMLRGQRDRDVAEMRFGCRDMSPEAVLPHVLQGCCARLGSFLACISASTCIPRPLGKSSRSFCVRIRLARPYGSREMLQMLRDSSKAGFVRKTARDDGRKGSPAGSGLCGRENDVDPGIAKFRGLPIWLHALVHVLCVAVSGGR